VPAYSSHKGSGHTTHSGLLKTGAAGLSQASCYNSSPPYISASSLSSCSAGDGCWAWETPHLEVTTCSGPCCF